MFDSCNVMMCNVLSNLIMTMERMTFKFFPIVIYFNRDNIYSLFSSLSSRPIISDSKYLNYNTSDLIFIPTIIQYISIILFVVITYYEATHYP